MSLKQIVPSPARASTPLHEAFERQRAARDAASTRDYAARVAALDALAGLLRANADALCAAVDRDFRGRAPQETRGDQDGSIVEEQAVQAPGRGEIEVAQGG